MTLPMRRHRLALDAQHALVFVRENFDELGQHRIPVFQDPVGARAAGILGVPRDPVAQVLDVFLVPAVPDPRWRGCSVVF